MTLMGEAPWVLVIAGVTPLGRRRALRAVDRALETGENVVVIDAQVPALRAGDLAPSDAHRVSVHSFGLDERTGMAARLTEPGGKRRGRVWRAVGLRTGVMLRPMAVWSRAKPAIRPLEGGSAPVRIVCCDEAAITTAWKSARIWPGVPVEAG